MSTSPFFPFSLFCSYASLQEVGVENSGEEELVERGEREGQKAYLTSIVVIWPRCPLDVEDVQSDSDGAFWIILQRSLTRKLSHRTGNASSAQPPTNLPLIPAFTSPYHSHPLLWRGWSKNHKSGPFNHSTIQDDPSLVS